MYAAYFSAVAEKIHHLYWLQKRSSKLLVRKYAASKTY